MIIVGIDPGKDGAVVAKHGDLIRAWTARNDYTLAVGKGTKRAYDEWRMAALLRDLSPALVILERQRAMPKQGSTSAYTIGLGEGIWRGICAGLGLDYEVVRPQDWQREVFRGIGGEGKDRSILVCRRRFGDLDLTPGKRRKPHDGIADAACMVIYGMRRPS